MVMLDIFRSWKPDWLYESMPGVYFIAGIASIFYFDNFLGYCTGGLLVAVAGVVLAMRKQHRI